MNKIFSSVLLLFSFLAVSCSGQMGRMLPPSLDDKGEAKLGSVYHDEKALAVFNKDALLQPALAEFKPQGISAGEYNFGGITIVMGLARCQTTDDAYGIYSALTAMPRERWEFKRGEMSYRSPYFAGYTGEYAFWIYSPTNPMTYGAFYRTHGEKILAEFETMRKQPGCSYHWKILPAENRYADSIFFVRSRTIGRVDVVNAYGATYQARTKTAHIYVQKLDTDQDALNRFVRQVGRLKGAGKTITAFAPMPGAQAQACSWQEDAGTWVLCQYRWIMFIITDMPSQEYANNFIRIIFNNMLKVRAEAMPVKQE